MTTVSILTATEAAGWAAAREQVRRQCPADSIATVLFAPDLHGLGPWVEDWQVQRATWRGHGLARFLAHPSVRAWLLGFLAVTDREDGVAEAAILHDPFFPLQLGDIALALVARSEKDPARQTVASAREWLERARRQRLERSLTEVLEDLRRGTQFESCLANGANAENERWVIDELTAALRQLAWERDLDLDDLAEEVRGWLAAGALPPGQVDLPPGFHLLPGNLAWEGEVATAVIVPGRATGEPFGSWSIERREGGGLEVAHREGGVRVLVTGQLVVILPTKPALAAELVARHWPDLGEA